MVAQSERREKTRLKLLNSARELFSSQGYEATTMDEVAEGAGVAKGALYHHFKSKHDLFEVVMREISAETAIAVQKDLESDPDIVQTMRVGMQKFFTYCAEPEVTQILLIDGPAILGWKHWREIDAQNFGGLVRAILSQGIEAGIIERQPVEPLAHLLIGAISEAAMSCANRDSFEDASREYIAGLDVLIKGLLKD